MKDAYRHVTPITSFRNRFAFSLALVSLLFISLAAHAAIKPSQEQLAAITARGRLLAAYDQAAWHATDAVQATHPPEGSVNRYIARKSDQGWIVDFGQINEAKDKFLVSYEAAQTEPSVPFTVKRLDPLREDTGWNLTGAKAIDAALENFHGADRPYNVAALPDGAGGAYVYLYPAQLKANIFPLGADARYDFASSGSLIEKRPLHKSIIEPGPIPAGTKAAGGYHTHVLTDLPEDTDVFLVLTREPRMPEFVAAGKYIFKVDIDGTISIADSLK